MIIVDASVAAKWYLPEPGESAARTLLASEEPLAAPDLIRTEVAAAILRKARTNEISLDHAQRSIDLWVRTLAEGVIMLSPDALDLPLAVEIALALRHPLQDCLYLAAAHRLDGTCLTADRRFYDRAQSTHQRLRLLATE